MIGRFTTRKFESRDALIAERPFEVLESYNRFTHVGMTWMWQMMAGALRTGEGTLTDHLNAGRIIVGNGTEPFMFNDERLSGDQTAQGEMDAGFPVISDIGDPELDDVLGVQIVFRTTFGEDQAVFDWQERGVVTAQGVLIDRAVRDQGRKVLGAVWQLEASLRLGEAP